jgi:hypothetical protein
VTGIDLGTGLYVQITTTAAAIHDDDHDARVVNTSRVHAWMGQGWGGGWMDGAARTMLDLCTSSAVRGAVPCGFFRLSWKAAQVKSSCTRHLDEPTHAHERRITSGVARTGAEP